MPAAIGLAVVAVLLVIAVALAVIDDDRFGP